MSPSPKIPTTAPTAPACGATASSTNHVAASNAWETVRKAATLAKASSRANCQATDGTWFYDTSTTPDRLYVNAPASGDADISATSEVYTVSLGGTNINGITFTSCTDCTIDGIDFANWCTPGPAQGGWSVRFAGSCARCIHKNGTTWNAGRHVSGVVGGSQGCKVLSHTALGMHSDGNETSLNPFVIAATNGQGSITSGEMSYNTFHAHNLLQPGGTTPVDTSATSFQLLQTHGDGSDTIGGVDCVANVMVGYSVTDSRTTDRYQYASVQDTASFTDNGSFSAYPVRFTGAGLTPVCRGSRGPYDGAVGNKTLIGGSGDFAVRRAFFRVDGWGSSITSASYLVQSENAVRHRYDDCVFWADMDACSAARCGIFYCEAVGGVIELNRCTVYIDGVTTGLRTPTIFWAVESTTKKFQLRQCIFDSETLARFGRMSTASGGATVWDVEDCWYENCSDSEFLDPLNADAAINTKAEWTSVIDPDGVYDTDPGFTAEASADLSLDRDGEAWSTRKVLTAGANSQGIDGKPYSGAYGAYQESDNAPRGRNYRSRGFFLGR